jgi:hypothetical protein
VLEAKQCRKRAIEYARNAETIEDAKSKERFANLAEKLNKLAYELERTEAILAAHLRPSMLKQKHRQRRGRQKKRKADLLGEFH